MRNVPLEHLCDYFFDTEKNRVWGRIFLCRHDGPFRLQQEEIDYGFFMDIEEILQLQTTEALTPDSIVLLQRLRPVLRSVNAPAGAEKQLDLHPGEL